MKKAFVFCIGGTGIRVMKSIVMLMAGGMSTKGYTIVPVVLDPHLDLKEKKDLGKLLEAYAALHDSITDDADGRITLDDGFFNAELRGLAEICQQATGRDQAVGSNEKFRSYINLSQLATDDINNYLVQTIFSTKNLDNPLSVGFKGNPNVGTVVLGDMIDNASWYHDFLGHCEKDDRVFIIGSIFGGTGASGYPLLENKIRHAESYPMVKNVVMGAVTVLPYYALSDSEETGSDIDSHNFYTKTKAALAYYDGHVKSDFLYYIGEKSLRATYDNNEAVQNDRANFIELVAASALFDFLDRERPERTQYLCRAIDEDVESLELRSMGRGYGDMVKNVADFMLLSELCDVLPQEKQFPLKRNCGFNEAFYADTEFGALKDFAAIYAQWYEEISHNSRAFAPLSRTSRSDMAGWVKGMTLAAKDDSHYLLEMIKAANASTQRQGTNQLRDFLTFAYKAVNRFTSKITE